MRRWRLGLVLGLVLTMWEWAPVLPPDPLLGIAQVKAQIGLDGLPPNRFHPFRGGTNCVQVVNADGNFSCSPLVTINPTTGAFNSVLGGPISQAVTLVVGPSGNTLQALGNDLVIGKSATTIAPFGPGVGGLTLRVRPSPLIPGYCRLVVVAGTSGVEFPIALLNPAYPFPVSGYASPAIAPLIDAFQIDLPGGATGC